MKAWAAIVNDDRAQAALFAALVRKVGLETAVFEGAEAMLDWVEQHCLTAPDQPSEQLPSLIVTDIHMPDIDGWQFCRLLRSPEYAALNPVPIVVVSAVFTGEQPERIAVDLGADAFFEAPVDGLTFVNNVGQILAGRRPQVIPRVLIVEDSTALSTVLAAVVDAAGYRVDAAFSVPQARAMFAHAAPTYDVAILDYHLPEGTGEQLLTEFTAANPLCVCVMMTSDPNPKLAVRLMKRGAAAYLRKPFEPEFLVAMIERVRRERSLLRVEDLLNQRTRELQASEDRFRAIAHNASDGILVFENNIVTYASPAYARILGYDEHEEIGRTLDAIAALIHPDDRDRVVSSILSAIANGRQTLDLSYTYRAKAHDGRWVWREDHARLLFDDQGVYRSAVVVCRDISERKHAEELLEKNLREKEVLLREIHHRVKNNLAVVSSLLSIQSEQITDPAHALVAFQNSRDRVLSMALVHQELYESRDYAHVEMQSYIARLTEQIVASHGAEDRIAVRVTGAPMQLEIDTAVPCGLIINELLTNAIKYAYPDGRHGEVTVAFGREGRICSVEVGDSGIGLPDGYELHGSLGLTLVRLLTDQIAGSLRIVADQGTRVSVHFPETGHKQRP